jgi:hypothetical protein
MKLAIVGSRNFDNYPLFCNKLKEFVDKYGAPELVVSGGAEGADTFAEIWAKSNSIPTKIFKPDWSTGNHAGFRRNTDIINECTHVLAFPSHSGTGTQDSIAKARRSGKMTVIYFID